MDRLSSQDTDMVRQAAHNMEDAQVSTPLQDS